MELMWWKFKVHNEKYKMKLSELASSFRCDKFEDYICKNANLNTKNAKTNNEGHYVHI